MQLLASGSMLNEALGAAKLLKNDWNIDSSVWSVTSYSELHKEAEDVRRWNILHPDSKPKKSFLEEMISPENGPVIALSDYVKLVAEQISSYIDCPFVALGTDGFGRSETRKELRNFFEVNRYYIVMAAMESLKKLGLVKKSNVIKVIATYNLDPEKPNPVKV